MSFRIGTVRRHRRRLRAWPIRDRGHGAFRIQQMVIAGAEAELDQRPRIGYFLVLPAMVGLVTAHGFFAVLVPRAGGLSAQVVLADQGLLNGLSSLGIDFLLAAHRLLPRGAFSRRGSVRFAGGLFRSGSGGCRFMMRRGRGGCAGRLLRGSVAA